MKNNAILHLVRCSAYQHDDFQQCLQTLTTADSIVLMDDGCYNLTHQLLGELVTKNIDIAIYFIATHAQARGISCHLTKASSIDMAQVVSLTLNHDGVITWQA